MPYYIFVENGKLNGCGECLQLTEGVMNIEVSEEVYNLYNETPEKYIYQDGEIVENPNYGEEQKQAREKDFNTEFFNTSLGYIRRKVTMANGDTKDFLSDLLPTIAMGIQLNQPVTVICYDKPDFTEEVTDWVKYQHVENATAQFVQECFMQLNKDFIGEQNIEEETYKQTNETTKNQEEGGN